MTDRSDRPVLARVAVGVILGACLVCGLGAGCTSTSSPAPAPERSLRVVASIGPYAFVAERIGGSRAQVDTLVPPGQSPHTFEPLPAQVSAIETANVFLTSGMPFETVITDKVRAARPDLQVPDLRQGITLLPAAEADPDHGAAAGEPDPHIWMDPRRLSRQALTIRDAFAAADPAGAATYDANLRGLRSDLEALDADLRTRLKGLRGTTMLVYHPAFGYFADAYGLHQVAVERSGKEPEARDLAALITLGKRDHVRAIFVQPSYPIVAAEALAREVGATVVQLDPLSRDYMANLRLMAEKITAAAPEVGHGS